MRILRIHRMDNLTHSGEEQRRDLISKEVLEVVCVPACVHAHTYTCVHACAHSHTEVKGFFFLIKMWAEGVAHSRVLVQHGQGLI